MVSKESISPRLVIIEGPEKGKVIPLKPGNTILGRTQGDFIISDPRMSRSHVALQFDVKNQKVEFTDLNSLNGTVRNLNPEESGVLIDGDKLQLGNTILDVQLNPEPTHTHAASLASLSLAKSDLKPLSDSEASAISEPHVKEPTPSQPEPRFKTEPPSLWISRASEFTQSRNGRFAMVGIVLLGIWILLPTQRHQHSSSQSPTVEKVSVAQIPDAELAEVTRYFTTQNWPQATSRVIELMQKYPDDSRGHLLAGNIYQAQKLYEPAIQAFLKAHEFTPTDPLVHAHLLRAYIQTGLKDAASKELGHIDTIIKEGKALPALYTEVGELFLEFPELNEPIEKVFIIAKALQNDIAPEHPVGYKLEAKYYLQTNKPDEAMAALEHGLKINPLDPWLFEQTTLTRIARQNFSAAVTAMVNWLNVQPGGETVLKAAQKIEDPREKILLFAKGIYSETNPQSTMGYKFEAQLYFSQNRASEAGGALERARKLAPQDPWLLENLAFARLALNDIDGSISIIENWMTMFPSATKPLLVMGYLKFNQGNFAGAIPFLQKIIQMTSERTNQPDYAAALHLMGQVFLKQDQTKEAKSYFFQSCQYGFAPACQHPLIAKTPPPANEDNAPTVGAAPAAEADKQPASTPEPDPKPETAPAPEAQRETQSSNEPPTEAEPTN